MEEINLVESFDEHKIFYLLYSRERIEQMVFKGDDMYKWIEKYGDESRVFNESDVINFIKKHKIA